MSKLNAELKQIDKLSLGSTMSHGMQTILVCAGVIGGLMLLFSLRSQPDDEGNTKKLHGPLTDYIVDVGSEDQIACRVPACTFSVVSPVIARVSMQRIARYEAPPVQTITPPAGQVFRDTRSFRFNWLTSWVAEPSGYTLVHLSGVNDGVNGETIESGDAVKVATPGYIRSAKTAGSDRQIALDGTVTDGGQQTPLYMGKNGQARLRSDNPPLVSLAFQPFNKTMTFELADIPDLILAAGDSGIIHFDLTSAVDQAATTIGEGIPAQITAVSRSGSPTSLRVQLTLADDVAERLLQERVLLEKNEGRAAFPEKMSLSLLPGYGRSEDQSLRIPASAIVRNGSDVFVWVVVDDHAIPVTIQELERRTEFSVVAEKVATRGLPIRTLDWQSMSAASRSLTYRKASKQHNLKVNQLLMPSAIVIEKPDNSLRPGARIRRSNATS